MGCAFDWPCCPLRSFMFLHLLFQNRHADADMPTGLVLRHDKRLSCLRIFAAAYFNMRKYVKYFSFNIIGIGHFFTVIF